MPIASSSSATGGGTSPRMRSCATSSARISRSRRKVRLARAPRGKPYLAHDGVDLRFNLSHSEDTALLAVARAREVGIDVEENRPGRDWLGIARRFFSPAEAAVLAELPSSEREAAFYRCWTRKEAYLKACGAGMSMRLDSFEVSLAPGEPPALLRSARGADEARRWPLFEVPAGAGFSAALAVESRGPGPAVRLFDLTGRAESID